MSIIIFHINYVMELTYLFSNMYSHIKNQPYSFNLYTFTPTTTMVEIFICLFSNFGLWIGVHFRVKQTKVGFAMRDKSD